MIRHTFHVFVLLTYFLTRLIDTFALATALINTLALASIVVLTPFTMPRGGFKLPLGLHVAH